MLPSGLPDATDTAAGTLAVTFLAGLAFFFLGLDFVKTSLKGLANRKFRAIVGRLVASGPLAAIWGAIFGAISQSATAVAFLLVGLVTSGLLPLRRALTVVSWANVGTAALVFVAAIDLRLATLFLIGMSGIAIGLGRTGKFEPLLKSFLGVGLLFLGLKFMKDATEPLPQQAWFEGVAESLNGSLALGLLAGALLRAVIQSSSGIIIVLVTLCVHGVLAPTQTLMCIHGTGIGIGLSVLLLGSGLSGNSRQLAIFQALINAISAVGLAAWLFAASGGLVPGLLDLVGTADPGRGLAASFAIQQVLTALVGTALSPRAPALLDRLAPPTLEQSLQKPRFLDESALETPDVALELVEREQRRMLGLVAGLLADVRSDRDPRPGEAPPAATRSALAALDGEVSGYLAELMRRDAGADARKRILALSDRERTLAQLATALEDLAAVVGPLRSDASAGPLATSLIESLDTILRTMVDVLERGDELDCMMLTEMTSDRGDLLEQARGAVVHRGGTTSPRAEVDLLLALSLFERTVWLVRQLRLVPPEPVPVAVGA
jgi:phosphate:Na+ symporter